MSQSGSFSGGGSSVLNVQTLTGDTGGAVAPTSNNIDLVGDGIVTVDGDPGTSTVTLNVSDAVATTYTTDSGDAVAATNTLVITGDSVITTSGATDTVTIDLVNGTDGQLLIGGGTEATWANLTSADGSVTITEGPNSIDLQVAGGGGGGIATITAGANIATTVVGSDVTVAVTDRIDLPATNISKTEGVLAIGDCEFFTYGIDEDEPNSNIFIGQNMPSTAVIDDSVLGVVCIGSGAMGAATNIQDRAIAIGYKAMENGDNSGAVAIGGNAMANALSSSGVAIGNLAMVNGGGQEAIAIGLQSLNNADSCDYSIAIGSNSMSSLGSGIINAISIGYQAMAFAGSGGSGAIAIGKAAMNNTGGGEAAIAIGEDAMQAGGGIDAIAIGRNAMLSGGTADDIAIGRDAMRDTGAGGGDAIAIGHQAMQSCSSTDSIAIGHDAMRQSVSPSSNISSIAIGRGAMELPQFSHFNSIGIGNFAMQNLPGSNNVVAIGDEAMRDFASIQQGGVVAVGYRALKTQASTKNRNFAIAIGSSAMSNNGGTRYGIAIGANAMLEGGDGGIGGDLCIAIGPEAMALPNSGGDDVIAIGFNAMNGFQGSRCIAIGSSSAAGNDSVSIGSAAESSTNAIAIGREAIAGANCISMLASTETYSNAIAIGRLAMRDATSGDGGGNNSIAIGAEAMRDACGANCIAIGANAGKNTPITSTNCIYLGTLGNSGDGSNTMRLGSGLTNTFISGIRGVTTAVNDAIGVLIDSSGQLGTVSSSIRYKENVQTLGADSDVLQRLRPVSFTYKNRPADRKEYGFIAEEVAEHIPDIVVYDADGQPETIQYHKLYGLMVSEIQRNHQKIKALEERLADLEGKVSIRLNFL